MEWARAAVHESGYAYKKVKSRSKRNSTEESDVELASIPRKHSRFDAEMRQQRIKVISEDIEVLKA